MPLSVLGDFAAFTARAVRLLTSLIGLYLSFFIIVEAIFSLAFLGPLMVLVAGAILFLLYAFSVTVHELGHAAAARLVGWHVHLIAVWPVGYRPRQRKFVRIPSAQRKGQLGWVVTTPPVGPDWDKGRTAVYLGGAAANTLCAAICFATLMAFAPSVLPHGVIGALEVISVAMAVGNLVPLETPRRNDGAVLLGLAMGTRTSQFEADSAWLAGYVLDGVDRRLWEPNLVHRLETDPAQDAQGQRRDSALLGRYLALGDVVRAHALLQNSPLAHSGADSGVVFLRAFLVAIVERDALKASTLLDQVPENVQGRSYNYWRARMTIHAVRGEVEEGRAAAKQARVFARKEGSTLDSDELALLEACELGEPPPLKFGREGA